MGANWARREDNFPSPTDFVKHVLDVKHCKRKGKEDTTTEIYVRSADYCYVSVVFFRRKLAVFDHRLLAATRTLWQDTKLR